MADAVRFVELSITELPQFGRIVEFLAWAREYAQDTLDQPLLDQLDTLAHDLATMNREMRDA